MEDFLKRFPQSEFAAEGHYAKGKSLFDAGAYEQAIVELQKTVVNFPGLAIAADAQLLTAEAYSQMKHWPEATQAYQKYLDYFPQHEQRAGAFFNMATAYFNAGDYKQSLKYFQTVLDSFSATEFAESARKNADISRKRLGAAEGEGEDATEPGAPEALPPVPDTGNAAPLPAPAVPQGPQRPTKGDNPP